MLLLQFISISSGKKGVEGIASVAKFMWRILLLLGTKDGKIIHKCLYLVDVTME